MKDFIEVYIAEEDLHHAHMQARRRRKDAKNYRAIEMGEESERREGDGFDSES